MKSRLVSTIREVRLGHEAEQVRLKLIRSNRLCRTDICCNPEQAFVAYSVLCFGPSFEHPYFCDHLLRRIHSQTGHFRQSDHGVLMRLHGLRDQTIELCDLPIISCSRSSCSASICRCIGCGLPVNASTSCSSLHFSRSSPKSANCFGSV